jgi:hypothetical protein
MSVIMLNAIMLYVVAPIKLLSFSHGSLGTALAGRSRLLSQVLVTCGKVGLL